jgi:hypothetical protein
METTSITAGKIYRLERYYDGEPAGFKVLVLSVGGDPVNPDHVTVCRTYNPPYLHDGSCG